MNIFSWINEPLSAGFFLRGLLAAVLVMFGGAVLGFGVLTRRLAYFGQGVSQSMLAGVAIGTVVGISTTPAAFLGAIIAAGLIGFFTRVRGLSSEAAVAIVSSAGLSIGVALISADRSRSVNLNNLLFGNILGVTWGELMTLSFIVLGAVVFNVLYGRRLALAALSPVVATAHGVKVKRLELLRLMTLALVTAAAVQVVGVTLVVAALVLPAAIAALVSRSLGGSYLVAGLSSVSIGVIGLYLSYWYDLASGPAVVLTGTALYLLTLTTTQLRRGF